MAFAVASQAKDPGDPVYYDPRFRTVIESHLTILRNSPTTQRQRISPDTIHRFEGDFYGLLIEMGVSFQFHWIFMRVNNLESPNQFGAQLRDPYRDRYEFTLLTPSTEAMNDLRSLFLTTQG